MLLMQTASSSSQAKHSHPDPLPPAPHRPLTPLGRSIKRVVIPAMLPGVCQSSDWRGELARWIARFLPRVPVVIWEARRWRYGRNDGGSSIRCRRCRNREAPKRQSLDYDCAHLDKGLGKGDLVIVVGTGTVGCVYKANLRDLPQCHLDRFEKSALPSIQAIDQLWDKDNVVAVHFPVRALNALTQERNIFRFDTIIEDDSFFKPMGGKGDIAEDMFRCWREEKNRDLLYVARYKEYKGQLKFVQQANPSLLAGYTIHFYGGGAMEDAIGRAYFNSIKTAADARGISVIVHNQVAKTELLKHICIASGQILWPLEDSNPRAAYEGLYAGMPLFISTTAGVPRPLLKRRFVVPVPHNATVESFNAGLEFFMQVVAETHDDIDKRKGIIRYTRARMDPETVYWELCMRMGICAPREDSTEAFD